jgi:hypothetical protein
VTIAVESILLNNYISDGRVNYSKLKEDEWLADQIECIRSTSLKEMTHNEKFVFWINTYNILTLHSVQLELNKNPDWKGNVLPISKLKFFISRKHEVAGKKLSLYHIENSILRKQFDDPRIHFALNCGSISCPYLPGRLFTVDNIEDYLNDMASNFINEQGGVVLKDDIVYLSRIFKWYKKDFNGDLLRFISDFWKGPPLERLKIKFMKYNWKINS